jgi:hypothetical protein
VSRSLVSLSICLSLHNCFYNKEKTTFLLARYVESSPKWAKQLEGEMSLGRHVLEFRARSPLTNQTAACQMIIHVKDTEPPRVSTCPHSFVDYLGMTTKYVYIKSTTAYVPLSELGLSQPLCRQRVYPSPQNRWGGGGHTRLLVRGWESPNSDDWRKSLSLCLLCGYDKQFLIDVISARDSEFGTCTVKKVSNFPVPSRDVINQTLHDGE